MYLFFGWVTVQQFILTKSSLKSCLNFKLKLEKNILFQLHILSYILLIYKV